MCVESKKPIYKTLYVLVLFWMKLAKSIENGISQKQLQLVCEKKVIKVQQCTILWYAKDPKMSRVDSDVDYGVLDDINSEYSQIANMAITQGKIHRYLRMTTN